MVSFHRMKRLEQGTSEPGPLGHRTHAQPLMAVGTDQEQMGTLQGVQASDRKHFLNSPQEKDRKETLNDQVTVILFKYLPFPSKKFCKVQ